MREKYYKQGAAYELSNETKQELGLAEPAQWTLDRLDSVQYRMAEPLLLYWYSLHRLGAIGSKIIHLITYYFQKGNIPNHSSISPQNNDLIYIISGLLDSC